MKDVNLHAVKGLAIIGVVFTHLNNRRFSLEVRDTLEVLEVAFAWCVLTFFAASGWLHAASNEKERRGICKFAANRARRLLLPYVGFIIVYSLIWQAIQSFGHIALRDAIPATFSGKILSSLFPVNGHEVAGQLYFFPMLFIVSILAHAVLLVAGYRGLVGLVATALSVCVLVYAKSSNTGFNAGVAMWGLFCYSAGFIMYRHRDCKWLIPACYALAVLMFIVMGAAALPKIVALLLLSSMQLIDFNMLPFLARVGEASGTIYVYHTPFLLQPLMVIVGRASNDCVQLAGCMLSSVVVIALCTILFFRSKHTFLKSLAF